MKRSRSCFCPHCGLQFGFPPKSLRCDSCHAPVVKDWLFCAECGNQLNSPDTVTAQPTIDGHLRAVQRVRTYPVIAKLTEETNKWLRVTCADRRSSIRDIVWELALVAPTVLPIVPAGNMSASVNFDIEQHNRIRELAAQRGISARAYLRSIVAWGRKEGYR